jgi:hypothetical protein
MTDGKTKSGFKFSINENIFKDWEFTTLVDSIRNGGTMKDVNDLYIMMLGEKGFDALKKHIRKIYGYVDVEAMKSEITEITNSAKVKN